MNTAELLSIPHSQLTRKQRKERARVKRQVRRDLGLPAGFAVGQVRITDPPPNSAEVKQAIEQRRLDPRSGTVMVRILGYQPPYAVGKP
jgi:hypothetical protein